MDYPVMFEMDYAERRSRLTTFFRYLLAIPHFIFWFIYFIAFYIVEIVAWFALMFTGRWPQGLYDFACNFVRYATRLSAYFALGVDQYPPFSGAPDDNYPVRVHFAPPLDHYSRLKVFFRPIYSILAVVICYALGIVMSIVSFLSWFVIVFTGRQPISFQNALNMCLSYTTKADGLIFLITETYPPFGQTGPVTAHGLT